MSWSGLASNQMVTFTNAQAGGFTLQPGQSSVTSNQCMTKNDALTKYVLDSSFMSSYASNQLVPKSTWVSGSSSFPYGVSLSRLTGSSACVLDFPNTWYSATPTPVFGSTMYSDSGLTVPFTGGDLWYGADGAMFGSSYQVNNSGVIIDVYNCMY